MFLLLLLLFKIYEHQCHCFHIGFHGISLTFFGLPEIFHKIHQFPDVRHPSWSEGFKVIVFSVFEYFPHFDRFWHSNQFHEIYGKWISMPNLGKWGEILKNTKNYKFEALPP